MSGRKKARAKKPPARRSRPRKPVVSQYTRDTIEKAFRLVRWVTNYHAGAIAQGLDVTDEIILRRIDGHVRSALALVGGRSPQVELDVAVSQLITDLEDMSGKELT